MTPTKQLDRPVHIGIDYGTSASKLVFRDYGAPGGERAYVVERSGSYRIPADVGATDSELVFGQSRDADHAAIHTWYESVKMRVAGEVMGDLNTFYRAPLTALPRGFNAIDLAVLSVWTLIAAGADSAGKHLGAAASRMALAVTMGVPTSFYKSRELRNVFASITRRAYEMYRQSPASR